jgi:hypothetical protein
VAAGLGLSEQFITLFNNLKQAAGSSPERVPIFYKDSKPIRDALHALHEFLARTDLERRVFHGRKIFVPRAAGFEAAWKEYDSKWRFRLIYPVLSLDEIELESLELDLARDLELEAEAQDDQAAGESADGGDAAVSPDGAALPSVRGQQVEIEPESPRDAERVEPETAREAEAVKPDPEIEASFDPLRHDGGYAIQLGIEQLEMNADHSFTSRGQNSSCLALDAYEYLTGTIELNIHNVFQRWRKVPVVFMPAHVYNRYGASDKGSLLHLLNDAVRAYVFGAPAAAIAMCRAALETVLKRHYGRGQWEDVKLGRLVVLASQQYDFVQQNKITPLVDRANEILHNYTQEDRLSDDDERAILNFLKTVKFLIQRAPKR